MSYSSAIGCANVTFRPQQEEKVGLLHVQAQLPKPRQPNYILRGLVCSLLLLLAILHTFSSVVRTKSLQVPAEKLYDFEDVRPLPYELHYRKVT